ncbi:FMRFamide receptor-like [Brachionus plicatilis]|uniref:FMRFamide receptor-like n=1 Tax=Brachionus plicatilis TaxID=10195 RepID=A0A3M7PST6_BRAPC|nr:FMRFamide receptor-like [Brachionus plicatilis]
MIRDMDEMEDANLTEDNFDYEEIDYSNINIISSLLITIICIGTFGNVLNIIIFSKTNMRQASTFRFLLYLSISDLLVLLFCSTDALARFGFQIEIRSTHIILCKIHTFLTYFLTHSSSIILMVISIDRALVVTNKSFSDIFFGSKRKSFSKKARLKGTGQQTESSTIRFFLPDFKWFFYKLHRVDLTIGCVFTALFLLNSHFLFINLNLIVENNSTSSGQFYICFPLPDSAYFNFLNNIWIFIDIGVFSMVPFIVMSICSVIILTRIRSKSKKYFERLVNKNNEQQKTNISKRLRRNRQLLYMLLLTNLYFLLSMLPYCVMFILFKGKQSESSIEQPLVHTLLYTNNAINFIFYGFSSQKYRKELYSLFSKRFKDNEHVFLTRI